jgi:hypothetical protein
MSKQEVGQKLVGVKLALAEKCDRLAKVTKSAPRRNTLKTQAAKFRRQAADLARQSQ